MNRVMLVALCGLALSCGGPPVKLPHADAGSGDRCEGAICYPGETCSATLGCFCTPDSCPDPAICNESTRCENLCASADCSQGEVCVRDTGRCECGNGTDPCAADRFCDPANKRCSTKCTPSTGCPRGEICDPATGNCKCADCISEQKGCDATTNRCVNRCPSACPVGEACQDPVVGECHCTATSCPTNQTCETTNQRCVDLCLGVACSPGEKCNFATGACVCDQCGSRDKCDPDTNRCVSKCQGVTCSPGEACQDSSGECHCGISPNTCGNGKKCDSGTLKCVDICQGVTCQTPGESCNATSGLCACTGGAADTCKAADPKTACDASSGKCVALCLNVVCAPGESCNPLTGSCECQATPADTCSAAALAIRCNTLTKHCEEKCKNVTCVQGEACVANSGDCHCGIPNTCPTGKKCDSSSLKCVGLCSGVSCSVAGESCDPTTGVCACKTNPSDTCTAAVATSKCDPATFKCVSQCAGVSCVPGESCNASGGTCECQATPTDTCTDAQPTMRCEPSSKKCWLKCQGVSCASGESCVATSGACACIVSPNSCPTGKKCDPGTLHCVNMCAGVTCTTLGESCDGLTGVCRCLLTPSDTCTAAVPTTKCDGATSKCVSQCAGINCVPGESCNLAAGKCECTASPTDSCSAAQPTMRCEPASKHCLLKCQGVSCATGETCVATSGLCACSVSPNSCPATKKCDPGTFHCVDVCAGVSCPVSGEHCDTVTGACVCNASPDSCNQADATSHCNVAKRCEPKCTGVTCASGETCVATTGLCACTASPDTCNQADGTKQCNAAGHCEPKCTGVSCVTGETCVATTGACHCSAGSCPAAQKCDVATLKCVPVCYGVTCPTPGESCDSQTGQCVCTSSPDSCSARDNTTRCGSGSKCVSKCQGVFCNLGESCAPTTGLCACAASPDSCNLADGTKHCNAAGHCEPKCTGVSCVSGETCIATTGVCHCSAGSCPTAQKCDVATLKCVSACYGVTCATPGESCDSLTGVCRCLSSPSDTCTQAVPTTKCDGATSKCISQCSGVNCYPGESCDPTPPPKCVCTTSPDSCASAGQKCDGPTLRCVPLCSGVSCNQGETCNTGNGHCECGAETCPANFACDVGTKHCVACPQETDTQFCTRLSKECDPLSGTDNCGRARSVNCGSCTSPKVCTSGRCLVPGGPVNDDCIGALPLTFDGSGLAHVTGDTTLATDSGHAAVCGVGYGNDVVYSFTTTAVKDVQVSLTFNGGTQYPVVYVRKACASPATADEVGCASGASGVVNLGLNNLPAGTYWVWADAYSGDVGSFSLNVQLSTPPPLPGNDSCSAPQALTIVSNAATASGDTRSAANDYSGTCTSTNGGDVVYSVYLLAAKSLTATVTRDPSTPAYSPAVYVRKVCASALSTDEAGCGYDSGTGVATTTAPSVGPGTVYVIVDGVSASSGKFTLQVTLGNPITVPTNDTCANAAPVTFTSGFASFTSTTTWAKGDTSGTCAGSGPDLVWTFTTTTPTTISAWVTPTAGSPAYQPVVYLRSGACDGAGATEKACNAASSAGGTAFFSQTNLPAGTYWLWVDGFGGSLGDFYLDVGIYPLNDQCPGVQAIAAGTTYDGNTYNAFADYTGNAPGGAAPAFPSACNTSNYGAHGPDVVYSYTPSASGSFTATVTPQSGYDPVIWVTDGNCGTVASCKVYSDAGGSGTADSVTVAGVAGHAYYIVVGSFYASGALSNGTFTIKVQ